MPRTLDVLVMSEDRQTIELASAIVRELDAHVYEATSVATAESIARRRPLDVVIADVRSLRRDPASLVTHLRRYTAAPVLMLTSGDSERAARCLEVGADDCVRWPVSARELRARIRLRTSTMVDAPDGLCLDASRRAATNNGRTVELTEKEFDLISFMATSPGVVYSADQLLSAIWESTREWQSISTIREHIYRLRHKIEEDPRDPQLILTVRGHGYQLKG